MKQKTSFLYDLLPMFLDFSFVLFNRSGNFRPVFFVLYISMSVFRSFRGSSYYP